MTLDLLIAVISLGLAFGLLLIGMPNRRGDSPRFLQFKAAPMVYPPVVLIFLAIGVVELISWAVS